MNKKQIIEEVTSLVTPILEQGDYELVDIEFVKEGPNYYLRIFVDKEGGITVDDCVTITRALNPLLDEKDPIEPAYMLEVSSPGLDRILKREKDFERFKGEMVDVKLYEAFNKKKHFIAKLLSKTDELLTLEDEDEVINIPMKNVAIVRLAILF
ncbi:ribosome maturation factor RimP [Sporanaerobium hydrogeniformans]|uniref:Ribosome maturation factor RimP n=1 Tax=Sporanaerobium hydrogeniformans TaxID=3072179 RepID=A0AC61DF42_9FIRM|nr:ribosome maturation factor RimP [Sporanaerobium hydrogeniformans]PHV71894.1 ribosome maturation factor RimP [Sporanaerobium hydrogeniformans]